MGGRLKIRLDDVLLDRVRQLVPSREVNRFISQAIEDKINSLERSQLEAQMQEGYLAVRQDRAELNADWQVVDVEDWPEYVGEGG